MKRLIFLILPYGKKPETVLQKFREEVKQFPFIKIIQELSPKPQVVVEFPDKQYSEAYNGLRKLDVVEIIDLQLPLEDK